MICNSQKTLSCGAVTGVGFMLIDAVLCLQSQFEDCTFRIAEYSNILLQEAMESSAFPDNL